ncbi:MAG TPA: hypothetical protein VFX64_06370 [Candidatus Nitrosotalea sp.]|nr:hypothetical protein [Candidatus Nitrosotalea sp.]
MKLQIANDILEIKFSTTEKILAIHGSMQIPLSHVVQATGTPLEPTWMQIRMPGTNLPGMIKAGTYYTNRGKEFWYLTRGNEVLRLELKDESYDRIVIGVKDSSFWTSRLGIGK